MIQIEHNGVTLMVPEWERFRKTHAGVEQFLYDNGMWASIVDILNGYYGPLALDNLCNAAYVALIEEAAKSGNGEQLRIAAEAWRKVKEGAKG